MPLLAALFRPRVGEVLLADAAVSAPTDFVRQLQSSRVMQTDESRPEAVWQFYMTEGIALRALASAAKTKDVKDQLLRIADMYDQLANYLRGSETPAADAVPS
jgi:hypothetical protein